MDLSVIDSVSNKRMSEFADIVKAELRKKIMSNEYIKTKADQATQFNKITSTLADLRSSININNNN